MKTTLSLAVIAIMFAIGCSKEKGTDPTNPATAAQKAPSDGLDPMTTLTFYPGPLYGEPYCSTPAGDCLPEVIIYGLSYSGIVSALNATVTGTTTGGPSAVAAFFSDSAYVMATFPYLYKCSGKPTCLLTSLRSGDYSLTLSTNTTTNHNYYQIINASTGILKMVMVDSVNTSL